jgi:hypothetical protein
MHFASLRCQSKRSRSSVCSDDKVAKGTRTLVHRRVDVLKVRLDSGIVARGKGHFATADIEEGRKSFAKRRWYVRRNFSADLSCTPYSGSGFSDASSRSP